MRGRHGFTLIELMVVVVAVIDLLTAIAVPLYTNMQVRARVATRSRPPATISSSACPEGGDRHFGSGIP